MKEVEKKKIYVVLYMFFFWGGEGGRVGYPGFICEVLVSEKWCCCFFADIEVKKMLCMVMFYQNPRRTQTKINYNDHQWHVQEQQPSTL